MLLGLVGKPSSGKSTFFKAATLADVLIAAYPFATIKPNHGIGYVKIDCIDSEFKTQCNPKHGFCKNHKRFIPIDLMDVAGLVPGASEGKGLGNQFLDNLREADAFIHIVDISGTTDIEGKQTENHDPRQDIKFLEDELDAWYLNILNKTWQPLARKMGIEKTDLAKTIAKQFSGLKINESQIKDVLRRLNNPENPAQWSPEQLKKFAHNLRHKSKPMIIAANKCDHINAEDNLKKIKEDFPGYSIIPCSADSELALREANKAGLIDYTPGDSSFKIIKDVNERQKSALEKIKKDVLEKYGNTGIQQTLNFAIFDLLKYMAIFPAGANKLGDQYGNILPDCFLLPENSTALDFAYHLHTNFGDNFIKAIDARSKKALGKDYKLKNRDALEIVSK
jgi:hypothetical protein